MKTFAVIHARLSSSRLKHKVIKNFCGNPMISFQIQRLKKSKLVDRIIVATTNKKEDDKIVKLAIENNVNFSRGSQNDVLKRIFYSVKKNNPKFIIRISGDNPLIDPEIVDLVIKELHSGKYDHVSSFAQPSYPYGVGCAGFTFEALEEAFLKTRNRLDREDVEPYMLKTREIKTLYLKAPKKLHKPDIRVTVDTSFDFEKVEKCAEFLLRKYGISFRTKEIIEYFENCKILVVANGSVGLKCIRNLVSKNQRILGIVLSKNDEYSLNTKIKKASNLVKEDIHQTNSLSSSATKKWILSRNPDIILSLWSRLIFPKEIIKKVPRGIINLHNSLLPLARGGEANIWPIIENHDAGVSIHYINEEIDQGPIIFQKKIKKYDWDTGKTLFIRLERELVALFIKNWEKIKFCNVNLKKQEGKTTYHKRRESNKFREIFKKKKYTGERIIDILRAFSFSPYDGAYFIDKDGKKIDIKVSLKKLK